MTQEINKGLFPAKEEIFSWICDLTQWGHRKTGTPEGRKSAEYIAQKMRDFGLEDVAIETVPSVCMDVEEYSLEIDGKEQECFFINATNRETETGSFSIGTDNSKQKFIYVGEGKPEDFKGIDVKDKIVVCSIVLPQTGPTVYKEWNKNAEMFDPEGKINKSIVTCDIYSPHIWPYNYFTAIKEGAAGFVGILENYFDDPYFYCEDYTEIGNSVGLEFMNIPGMWVSKSTGKELKKKFEKEGELEGLMKMKSVYQKKDALNVKGILKGEEDDIILMHSHHDAVFDGAVQDASGIAEMLALAKYFSEVPEGERKKTMMFAATDTHYTDYMGHQGFIEARRKAGDNIILDISIEHIGKEVAYNEKQELAPTGDVETRVVYVTENTGLYEFVKETVRKNNLKKTVFLPVEGKSIDENGNYTFRQDEIITDAYYFNEKDIPVISFISGPVYLFHPSDRADMVAVDELQPIGLTVAEIAAEAAERL